MSEETNFILKLGGFILLLIPLLSFIEPIEKPLKEHLKDVLKVMAFISALCLFMAFLSHMELLQPLADFIKTKKILIPMITLTTAVPIFIELIRTLNEINRHNYKKEIGVLLFITVVVITVNQVVYYVLTHDLVPVAT